MSKMHPHLRTILAVLKPQESNLLFEIDPTGATGFVADMLASLGPKFELSDSDEQDEKLCRDWLAAHSNLLKVETVVPPDLQRAAFGEGCTLAAQGALVRFLETQIGGDDKKVTSAEAAILAAEIATRWGAKLGSIKPGVDPTAPPAGAKKAGPDKAPGKNPWNPKVPYPSEAARTAAKLSFMKVAGPKAAADMARPFLTERERSAYQFSVGAIGGHREA